MTLLGASGRQPPTLGRYELITRIGQGGMADVQLALQRGPAGFEKLVVVKLVHENLASQKPFVDMLLDEARLAALVKHPNVVDIYDLGEVDGRYFIAMEYLEGEPLLAVLRAGRDGERLDPLSTARLIADTAEGLDAAHELRSMAGDAIELVHHDVSLGNIVVLYNGQVKLVDFGVAKATQSAAVSTKVQGKFAYMAPEKLRGGRGDRRSDIWSLGCVLWEALTLRRLFKGGNDSDTMQQVLEAPILAPSAVSSDVPAELDPIVLGMLERDPEHRYHTAKAVASDLEEVLRQLGYAGKNDAIAKYMQATFESHIAARKRLLQQVSSKGRPSADVLEAAFQDTAIATGTPLSLPNGGSATRGPGLAMPAEPKLARASGPLRGVVPVFGEPRRVPTSELIALTADDAPTVVEPSRVHVPDERDAPDTRDARDRRDASAGRDAPELRDAPDGCDAPAARDAPAMRDARDARDARDRRRFWLYVAGATGCLAISIAMAIMVWGDGANAASEPAPVAPAGAPHAHQPPRPIASSVAADEPVRPPAEPPPITAPAAPPGVAPVPVVTAAPPLRGALAPSVAAEPPPPPRRAAGPRLAQADRSNPGEVSRTALQAWARGDSRMALALYKRVIQASPGYAPAWRGAGLVYEKIGDKAAARAAFQRYLQLAPSAPDAAGIRARLGPP